MSDDIGWFPAVNTYYSFAILIAVGKIRDWFEALFWRRKSHRKEGYAPLLGDFEDFYTRRLYARIADAWNCPISSCPANRMTVLGRDLKTLELNGKETRCINLGSYNYLGFADPDSPCQTDVYDALDHFSVATGSVRSGLGTTVLHHELETLVAEFLHKPACLVFGMGFGVNSTAIPFLVGKGDLVVSDSHNHSSIVFGCRSSGARVQVYAHNDVEMLERVVRKAIINGQPRTRRPWKKILIMVEGVYSMEGHTCNLEPIVRIKKKYGCYLYLDEAHSIGALGRTGRGITEHRGVNPADVDILMGTFTKSFGAVGGYIAGSADLIAKMRRKCAGSIHSQSISPVCCAQILSAFHVLQGHDGTNDGAQRLQRIKDNSNYFRSKLIEMGCHVLGDEDSPVVPVLIGNAAKMSAFAREALKEKIAAVVVGFPATAILGSRIRFCISASHTKEDLEEAVEKLDRVMTKVHLKYKLYTLG